MRLKARVLRVGFVETERKLVARCARVLDAFANAKLSLLVFLLVQVENGKLSDLWRRQQLHFLDRRFAVCCAASARLVRFPFTLWYKVLVFAAPAVLRLVFVIVAVRCSVRSRRCLLTLLRKRRWQIQRSVGVRVGRLPHRGVPHAKLTALSMRVKRNHEQIAERGALLDPRRQRRSAALCRLRSSLASRCGIWTRQRETSLSR